MVAKPNTRWKTVRKKLKQYGNKPIGFARLVKQHVSELPAQKAALARHGIRMPDLMSGEFMFDLRWKGKKYPFNGNPIEAIHYAREVELGMRKKGTYGLARRLAAGVRGNKRLARQRKRSTT